MAVPLNNAMGPISGGVAIEGQPVRSDEPLPQIKSSTETSHQYLMQLRICKAQKLLEESESPVIDIAAECGFQTQQHFARIFRRHTMRTPTEYRRHSQRLALVSSYQDSPYMSEITI
jgi:AraC-like DNA-binding protein